VALDTLLDKLDTSGKRAPAISRHFVRWPFRRESIEMRVVHPGGNVVSFRVACRNLSRGGICVLHNSFLHTGSECQVLLPHPFRGIIEVPGTVVRCLHRGGVIHELGISFRAAINAREFLHTDPFGNEFTLERISPAQLRGRLLLIEPSGADRSILRHYLRDTSLDVDVVGSLAEAVLACEGIDVVVASAPSADADAATLIATIRECRFDGPVVLIVPDSSPDTRARLAGLCVQVIVVQPITQDLLLRALGEVLLLEPIVRNAPERETPSDWTSARLSAIGKDLYQAVCADDPGAVREACQRLRAVSESMGWKSISRVINEVLPSLAKGKPIAQCRASLDMLLAACDSGPGSKAA
jgi:CheY-like chemotaxis protein